MTERRADYDEIAQVYDEVRVSEAPHLEWWYRRITELGQLGPGRRLVDLGCGTGRWTIPLARRTGCEAVGIDKSEEMLARAREKDAERRVAWVLGDVEAHRSGASGAEAGLGTCATDSRFDCALMSLMMHHLEHYADTFRGVRRMLRPGGVFLIRQGTLEDVMDSWRYRFFPEALTVDRKRTPFAQEIVGWLEEAGFPEVTFERVTQTTYESYERLRRELRLRVLSVFRLITDEQFERGLRCAEEYLVQHPDDETVRQDKFTLFCARKP